MEGILGADLIGFHTFDYGRHFLSSVLRILGIDHQDERIQIDNRVSVVETFPMGIDIDKFESEARKKDIQKEATKLKQNANSSALVKKIFPALVIPDNTLSPTMRTSALQKK